jgi:undecaprenyl-diphosphatase
MTIIQALLFAIIQGITELFPVSSVAHAVLTPFLFGWDLGPEFLKDHFLPFVVMLHLGTATALLIFFWRDWWSFLIGVLTGRDPTARRTFFLVVVATVPAALLGLIFQKMLQAIFSSVTSAAFFLIVNGFILFIGERLKGRGTREVHELTFVQAGIIGLAQSLALVPGFSRSGASMVAGFWAGLRHEASARFSMLLATPIIAGAGILVVPKMIHTASGEMVRVAAIGGLASGLFAFVAVWALMRWFRKHEVNAMGPFAIYCWLVGGVVLAGHWFHLFG